MEYEDFCNDIVDDKFEDSFRVTAKPNTDYYPIPITFIELAFEVIFWGNRRFFKKSKQMDFLKNTFRIYGFKTKKFSSNEITRIVYDKRELISFYKGKKMIKRMEVDNKNAVKVMKWAKKYNVKFYTQKQLS